MARCQNCGKVIVITRGELELCDACAREMNSDFSADDDD